MAIIEVRNLTYSYPGQSKPALKNINLQIEAGQSVAVLGANGAGKSTLCLALSGFIPGLFHGNMQGSVRVCDMETHLHTPGQFAGQVGLVLQNPANQLSGMRYTVYEEVAFGLENLGTPPTEMPGKIEEALKLTGLEGLESRSPYSLSGGQQQRLALAAVLALKPSVLILDEPTAMLDPQGCQDIFDIIWRLKMEGTTVVIASHALEWIATHTDRVLALSDGEVILDGPPEHILISPQLIETGIGWTRFTRAAHEGLTCNLWPKSLPLPISLEQATRGFGQGKSE